MSLVIFGETRNISGCDDYFRMRSSSLSPISNTQSQKFSLVPVFHLNSVLSDPPVGGNRRESFTTCSMLQLNPESEPPSEAVFLQSAFLTVVLHRGVVLFRHYSNVPVVLKWSRGQVCCVNTHICLTTKTSTQVVMSSRVKIKCQ